jgi:hypothetical protein
MRRILPAHPAFCRGDLGSPAPPFVLFPLPSLAKRVPTAVGGCFAFSANLRHFRKASGCRALSLLLITYYFAFIAGFSVSFRLPLLAGAGRYFLWSPKKVPKERRLRGWGPLPPLAPKNPATPRLFRLPLSLAKIHVRPHSAHLICRPVVRVATLKRGYGRKGNRKKGNQNFAPLCLQQATRLGCL